MVESVGVDGAGADRRKGRGIELMLLIFAAVLTTLALILVEADQQRPVTMSLLMLGVGYLALFVLAHVAVRFFAPYADPLILPCAALLNGLGLVMIHRLDLAYAADAQQQHQHIPSATAPMQVLWTGVSLALFVAVLWRVPDHRSLGRYSYTAGVVGLVLLVLPGVLPSSISEVNGAKLWVRIGPFSVQPGEFAKIAIIIFVAAFLVSKRDLFSTAGKHILGMDFPRARDLAPLVVAWFLSVGVLALEKELGASMLFFGVVLAMIYIATERVSWLLIGLVFFAVGCVAAYFMFAHVRVRVEVWNNPFAYAQNQGYQIVQALYGMANGGIAGSGLGRGEPDLVPFASTDFISSTIAEELGLVGFMAVLMVYLLMSLRGLRAALSVRDSFGKLLGGGLAFTIAFQVFVVVGGVTKLIPLTGMTMPFVSYGGSSLLANFILVALLLRVSNAAQQPVAPRKNKPQTPLAQAETEMVRRPT
jgi:cell division protein FtsW (lipid II flippase)